MIRGAIRTGTARMHRCTCGCAVLFRGTTGVGTHGLPTRSGVSDLTGRVIDAAISLAVVKVFMPPLHFAPPRWPASSCLMMLPSGFIPRVPRIRGERMPLGAGSRRRKKEEQVSRAVASGNLDRCRPDGNTAESSNVCPASQRENVLLTRF